MQQDVGVAVADELAVVRDVDAAQAQGSAGGQAVRVFADADAQVDRGWVSYALYYCADYSRVGK
jgi:hypothetical protein